MADEENIELCQKAGLFEIYIIPWLSDNSVANIQGIGSLPPTRFERKLGNLPSDDIAKIKKALFFACNLM